MGPWDKIRGQLRGQGNHRKETSLEGVTSGKKTEKHCFWKGCCNNKSGNQKTFETKDMVLQNNKIGEAFV